MMKAAIVSKLGMTPTFGEFPEPVPGVDEVRISVAAAALSQLTRGRASGRHYTSAGTVPFVPGVDGVGYTDARERVYFALPRSPFGAMAERSVVAAARTIPLPAALDDVTAAAIANPGMSSWAALTERAGLLKGETVLINGATGTSGMLAVQIAKHLGAGRVIATGRNPEVLSALRGLGADDVVKLDTDEPTLGARFEEMFAVGVDVVVDYLWGETATSILGAAARTATRTVRYVEVGAASGADIVLPGAVLRSSAITLMGSGIGSVPVERLLACIAGVFEAAANGHLGIAALALPLAEVEANWARSDARLVFVTR